MLKKQFPKIGQVRIYDQDGDNFVNNRVTLAVMIFYRPGKRAPSSFKISKEMLLYYDFVIREVSKMILDIKVPKAVHWKRRMYRFPLIAKALR
jgi:hypothetical protein